MDFTPVDEIARAILYEGYRLYPYRTSSLKNCRPCAFGSLYPRDYCQANGDIEPWSMQTECLARAEPGATIQATVRFLQSHGVERDVALPIHEIQDLTKRPARIDFSFQDEANSLHGCVELFAERAASSVFKLRVRIENDSPDDRGDCVMLSTHAILEIRGGRFLSLIDPTADAVELAQACRNRGVWPVLVGDRERATT